MIAEQEETARTDQAAPYVTIVLPCYNEEGHVIAEIERISAAMEASGYSYELMCVNDASPDFKVCAERVALFKALSEGERAFRAIAVVADTAVQAKDAADLVIVDYDVLPAVVTAAVPRRRPLVVKGFSGSFGIAFLLQVIPARSSASWAILPLTPNGRRSTSMRWLSVPPETMRKPSFASPVANPFALRTICAAYSLKSGCAARWNATAFAAMTCMSGPP